MRSGVWWSAAALLLIAAASSALRPSQVESTRTSRRFSTSLDSKVSTSTEKTEEVRPAVRSRNPRRREEPTPSTPFTPRENGRSRARTRTTDAYTSNSVTEPSLVESERNERFDSRRTNRIRGRPIENEANVVNAVASGEIPVKSKTRQINRRPQHVTAGTTLATPSVIEDSRTRDINNRRVQTTSTEVPISVSSPDVDDIKTEIITSTFDDFTRTVPKEEDITTVQFKRRTSTARTVESEASVGNPKPTRSRGRINTRPNVKLEDMASSGATNILSISEKNASIDRSSSADSKKSRKLRYRTRFSETDTNLAGEGITNSNEIAKSAAKKQAVSGEENRTLSPSINEKNTQRQSDRKSLQSTTIKTMRVVRRPLSRGKNNSATITTLPKVKTSEEIGDDDNYPETFKALIQAKNASTQVSSPPSESLSVKATHTVSNTYTQTSLPPNTSRDLNNNTTRLRSKLSQTENELKSDLVDNSKATELTSNSPKLNSKEYRPRGTYIPRSRKLSTLNSDTFTTSSTISPNKASYKFTRKLKTSTIEPPKLEKSLKTKRFEPGQPSQKNFVRTSYNSRKTFGTPTIATNPSSVTTVDENIKSDTETRSLKNRVKLPRTSYYSRLRTNAVSSEMPVTATNETAIADKKIENTAEMPLIFTLNKPDKSLVSNNESEFNRDGHKEEFLIAVSSRESQENNIKNEIVTKGEESENKPVINVYATTQKYHSNYKEPADEGKKGSANPSATPEIRNIQTRKYYRKNIKFSDKLESTSTNPVTKAKERTLRKYSDTFSKTTEASNNGITFESEKSKSRFSSKYRASHLDKPFYKPTVPTVTPTTAWLKFFVADHHLTELIEKPKWFEGNEYNDVTTELTSRFNITTSAFFHDSSSELVVGEEIELGPDMNAISFTQSRSTLSSADLKLSESLAKPSHVMNVEASNHSPSVTVSIFDALAEILTSTPRIQISTTTEVPQQVFTDSVVKQTLNGVSSNNNVNSASDLISQGTPMSTDNTKTTSSVQITDQTTPNVLNRLSVGESSPSLKTEDMNLMATNIPQTIPTPTPTTPVSARKPFAIKVLYSDTESPTDKFLTSSTTQLTTKWGTTDNPIMVYNTVSDLLLSNNNLVSAELTSMLSNNIKSIIENLDENSKSKLSIDMAKLLKTLIPRAVDKFPILTDVDSTTPYSLEEIKDTQNIDITDKENSTSDSENFLQNVTETNVNISQETFDSGISTAKDTEQDVNSTDNSQFILSSTLPELESMTTVADITTTTDIVSTVSPQSDFPTTTSKLNYEDTATLSNFEIDSTSTNNADTAISPSLTADNTNQPSPPPLFTNENVEVFSLSTINNSAPLISQPNNTENIDNIDIEDPSQLSRLQLWILSKKARVLKMIEQLIREHNNEIANPPLTEFMNQQNNIPFSSRLTNIINTMNSTTISSEANIASTTSNITPNTESDNVLPNTRAELSDSITTETLRNNFNTDFTVPTTTVINDVLPSTIPISTEHISSNGIDVTEVITSEAITEHVDTNNESSSTTAKSTEQTTMEELKEAQDLSENLITTTENTPVTIQMNTETIAQLIDIESTTETSYTTEGKIETTTQSGIDTTTVTFVNEIKPKDKITITNQINVATQPTIPKKDYVIFGILPNNTVVRKDPNDNVLETLTEASPYIVYGVLPNNTVIRKFPNGTRVPRVMQKIDVLPISPWSLRNPYSPIHNNPAIVRPRSNPIRVSTNIVTTDTNNGTENRLTTDTVNNQQTMISSSAPNVKDSSSLGITTATTKPFAEKSTASHVLSLRTTTMLPSIHEILLNSLSSATKEEMVISSMTSSTREPRILTLDIDPETKQIRTERPGDDNGNTVFKFIPIDEVTVSPQNTNVLKLASTKATATINTEKELQTVTPTTVTETNSPMLQIETRIESADEPTTTIKAIAGTPSDASMSINMIDSIPNTTEKSTIETTINLERITTQSSTSSVITTTDSPKTTPTVLTTTQALFESFTTSVPTTTRNIINENVATILPTQTTLETVDTTNSISTRPTNDVQNTSNKNQIDISLLQNLLAVLSTTVKPTTSQENEQIRLLQALFAATGQNPANTYKAKSIQTTTLRSIEDDLRQFEEDTKLLKALLQATGRNPNELKIPTLNDVKPTLPESNPTKPTTISTTAATTTQIIPTQTASMSTTNIDDKIKQNDEDGLLLQTLLKATGQDPNGVKLPVISGVTSNIRIASNPLTTTVESSPTTQTNIRPIYTTLQPAEKIIAQTEIPQTVSAFTNPQEQSTVTEDIGISTTYRPIERRIPTSTNAQFSTLSGRSASSSFQVTTEIPSTSTFSVEEDLAFLKNLKSVLNTNNNNNDPEAALANRVIALAVERSLNEIQTGTLPDPVRSGKTIKVNANSPARTTTIKSTTTTKMTTTATPPEIYSSTPSIEDDIKQFEEDTKLLQALLQATGQDPSKFNIPKLPTANVSLNIPPVINEDLKILSNLLTLPSPLNEPFDPLTQKPGIKVNQGDRVVSNPTTTKPLGAKIAVKDNLQNVNDDAQLLQTLIKLKDAQETTTQRNKLAITGQSSDEALKKLIQQAKPTAMVSEATKPSVSLSTEYGNSNDALLAALLKEQGFGPTTASSLDEQIRLAALLNQVVVTPKARRTTTPPPPPPAPRRPILDGLAWLWQQWRETAPGTGDSGSRTNRRPTPNSRPSVPPSAAPTRTNWFGSGPFVGNADDRPSSNRIPLEPPRAVAAEQSPGRGQLMSAAINVTRAFSQFLGAAIQGATQTVQNVIRAGQRAATDVYTNGSG